MIRWWKTSWGTLALALVCLVGLAAPGYAKPGDHAKLDKILNARAANGGHSRVIITLRPGGDASGEVRRLGGRLGRRLELINGQVAELPNGQLRRLADHPAIQSIHFDRPIAGQMNRVAVTVGARAVQLLSGYTGAGVGVAVIDSGVTAWHDDLTYSGSSPDVSVNGGQRIAAFADFVNGYTSPYDDNGHGTHVSGIIAGNGYDTYGVRAGIAPSAHIVSLKVLDGEGRGVISSVIAAFQYAVANKAAHNIRVINLSVGSAVTESFRTDPLALAARQAVDAGIVVVAAAGNLGRNAAGAVQYGGITAPGNAPWVLTVGASSHEGTVWRTDDVMALYSSRGPSALDFGAKPDLVAPGTGTVSLAAPEGRMYTTKADHLLSGTRATLYKPYLALSGTSMAAPVVAGTVALMLEANPNLTPNLVKGILQYTAQKYNYDSLTQGAGFLNSSGAVKLARYFRTAAPGSSLYVPQSWSREVIWGSTRIRGGHIRPNTNAWSLGTTWGSVLDRDGENIVWGTLCGAACENIVWGTFDALSDENIVWGTVFNDLGENIVWGTFLGGDENIVWGTLFDAENIVWGTDCGGRDCEGTVWGSFALDGENIVWGTAEFAENIVWGTSGADENIVWGTSSDASLAWASSGDEAKLFDDPTAEPVNYDGTVFDELFDGTFTGTSSAAAPPPGSTDTPTVTDPVTGIQEGGL